MTIYVYVKVILDQAHNCPVKIFTNAFNRLKRIEKEAFPGTRDREIKSFESLNILNQTVVDSFRASNRDFPQSLYWIIKTSPVMSRVVLVQTVVASAPVAENRVDQRQHGNRRRIGPHDARSK